MMNSMIPSQYLYTVGSILCSYNHIIYLLYILCIIISMQYLSNIKSTCLSILILYSVVYLIFMFHNLSSLSIFLNDLFSDLLCYSQNQ